QPAHSTLVPYTTLFRSFGVVQWIGATEQAKAMEWMTYGAIAGLVWFWIACIPGVQLDRVFTKPLLLHGWTGVFKAVPFAIWWLRSEEHTSELQSPDHIV